jgi:hypothetical protein
MTTGFALRDIETKASHAEMTYITKTRGQNEKNPNVQPVMCAFGL